MKMERFKCSFLKMKKIKNTKLEENHREHNLLDFLNCTLVLLKRKSCHTKHVKQLFSIDKNCYPVGRLVLFLFLKFYTVPRILATTFD